VTLHHGQQDADFDKRLWNYDDSTKNIRSILKGIK